MRKVLRTKVDGERAGKPGKQQAIARMKALQGKIDDLRGLTSQAPQFVKWHRDVGVAIERIFGEDSRQSDDFEEVKYFSLIRSHLTPDDIDETDCEEGLDRAHAILASMIEELETYEDDNPQLVAPNALAQVELLCRRFHLVARQLRTRHGERSTLEVKDEYDVQDLLHSLLHCYFDDIRTEEWTPSYAGGSGRMDFLLKGERIVLEVKKTRKGLGAKEIGDQLLIDIQRYQQHQDCRTLVCFIYDPEARLGNPRGLVRDLSRQVDDMKVVAIVTPPGA